MILALFPAHLIEIRFRGLCGELLLNRAEAAEIFDMLFCLGDKRCSMLDRFRFEGREPSLVFGADAAGAKTPDDGPDNPAEYRRAAGDYRHNA